MPLIKAAFEHRGAAFIDVISPCVTFNNHAGSTKSFDYVREHNIAVNALDVITGREPIEVDYAEGDRQDVVMHDGSTIRLRKLEADHDCRDRSAAFATLERYRAAREIATGLIYLNEKAENCTRASTRRRVRLTNLRSANCARDRRRCRRSTRH